MPQGWKRKLGILVVALLLSGATTLAHGAGGRPTAAPAAPPVPDGPRVELTLPDAVALGLRENRTIRSAYLQRIAQKFELRVAEDRFTPKLTLSASYRARRDLGFPGSSADLTPIATMVTPIGTQMALAWANTSDKIAGSDRFTSSNINFAVIQPLLRDGGLDVNMAPVRIAQLDEKVNRLGLKATVSQTVTEIIQAYRTFLQAQDQLRISRDALNRSRELLVLNRALIENGRMAEVEIIQTESDVANQELAVDQAANVVDQTRLALLEKLAIDPRTDLVSKEAIAVQPVRVSLDQALGVAFDSNPEYLSQLLAVEKAKLNVGVAKNRRLWDVSLITGTEATRQTLSDVKLQRHSYGGVKLSVPLGDLTAEKDEVNATVAERTATVGLEAIRQQVEHQTRDAVRNVEARWRQYEIASRARDLNARKLETEREKLQVGRSSNFQVLSFESDLRAAESARLSAMIGYLNALTILDQQVGTTLDTWQISLDD